MLAARPPPAAGSAQAGSRRPMQRRQMQRRCPVPSSQQLAACLKQPGKTSSRRQRRPLTRRRQQPAPQVPSFAYTHLQAAPYSLAAIEHNLAGTPACTHHQNFTANTQASPAFLMFLSQLLFLAFSLICVSACLFLIFCPACAQVWAWGRGCGTKRRCWRRTRSRCAPPRMAGAEKNSIWNSGFCRGR